MSGAAASAGEGPRRAILRYAGFIALTDYAVALVLTLVFSLLLVATGSEDDRLLEGVLTMLAFGAILATILLPVFLIVCAPVWFLARRALRRRGVSERRGAMLAAVPTAATGTLAMALFLFRPGFGGGWIDTEAAALYAIPLAASLVAAPLAARAVHRDA